MIKNTQSKTQLGEESDKSRAILVTLLGVFYHVRTGDLKKRRFLVLASFSSRMSTGMADYKQQPAFYVFYETNVQNVVQNVINRGNTVLSKPAVAVSGRLSEPYQGLF